MRKALVALVLAVIASLGLLTVPQQAVAQTMPMENPGRVTAFPQGMIGTGLVGAELGIMIEAAAGVRNRWVLIGTGAALLVGGGVGGFFIDQAIDNANGPSQISTGLLVLGLGLVIPTAIVYANATMYRPEDAALHSDDNAPINAPLEESTHPAGGAGPAVAPAGGTSSLTPQRSAPEAMVNYRPGQLRLGVPAFGLVPSYSLQEMRQYGLAAQSEWRVALLTARF